MAAPLPDRESQLKELPKVEYAKPEKSDADRFDQVNLAASLLSLADLGHERQMALCQTIAEHLLGALPEPDDAALGER